MAAVTVILPVYNGENYLHESIASVLQQDLSDFELHVLDDGSSDGSERIARFDRRSESPILQKPRAVRIVPNSQPGLRGSHY